MKAKCAAIITSIILASAMSGCGTGTHTGSGTSSVDSGVVSVSDGAASSESASAVEQQGTSEQEAEDNGFGFCLSRDGIDPIYFNIPQEFNIQNFSQQHMKYDGTYTSKEYYLMSLDYMEDRNQRTSADFSYIRGLAIQEIESEGELGDIVDNVDTPYGKLDIYYKFEGNNLSGSSTGCEIQTVILENNSKKIAIQITFSPNRYLDGKYDGEMKEFLTDMFTPIDRINHVTRRMEFPNLTDLNIEIDDTAYDTLFGGKRKGEEALLFYGTNLDKLTDWSDSKSGYFTDAKDRTVYDEIKKFGHNGEWTLVIVAEKSRTWFDQQYLIENNQNGECRIEELREADEVTLQSGQVIIYYVKVLAGDNQIREQEVGVLMNNGGYVYFALTLGEYDDQYDGTLKELLLSME